MQIFVTTLDGKSRTVAVRAHDCILQIKGEIQQQENIPQYKQQLFFSGKRLENWRVLSDCNITDGSTLQLVPRLGGCENRINVRMLTGKTFQLDVEFSDSIQDVKAAIYRQEVIPIDLQKLTFDGKLLDDCHTLSYYNVVKDSTLWLGLRLGGGFMLFAKMPSGDQVSLSLMITDTIKEVKARIERLQGVPIERQCLVYSGVELKDEHTVLNYEIPKASTLILSVKSVFPRGLTLNL